MKEYCVIDKKVTGTPTFEGAGVKLNRIFGYHTVPHFDPFLLLDDFGSENPDDYMKGFPWHPHRGIETVTYMLNGTVEHGDSLGNKGSIHSGDIQWMTAGSGIIHQEMPQHFDGHFRGFQLWVNLPASSKMTKPTYRDARSADLGELKLAPGVQARIVSGSLEDASGPLKDLIVDVDYFDLSFDPGSQVEIAIKEGHRAFVYPISGHGRIASDDEAPLEAGHAYRLSACDTLALAANDSPFRLLYVSGKPLGEPIAWGGPIVMNTRDEITTAFQEYKNGTFLKHQPG